MINLGVLLVILIAVSGKGGLGLDCHFKYDGRKGICVPLHKCKHALNAKQTCKLRPDIESCGSGIMEPDVCCTKKIQTKPLRPLDFMCLRINNYKQRIIGSRKVNTAPYPHAAALGYETGDRKGYDWKCGGALITENYVLTAAHCVSSPPNIVLLGTSDLLKYNPHAQIREVYKVIPHEKYKPKSITFENDIALVELKAPVKVTNYVCPTCIYTRQNLKFDKVTTVGWGESSDIEEEKILKEANLTVTECNAREMICVKSEHDAACLGDSGGPLMYIPNNRAYIVGVNSHGSQRCSSETTSYFLDIRLPKFLNWIEKKIWPIDRCLYKNKIPY